MHPLLALCSIIITRVDCPLRYPCHTEADLVMPYSATRQHDNYGKEPNANTTLQIHCHLRNAWLES